MLFSDGWDNRGQSEIDKGQICVSLWFCYRRKCADRGGKTLTASWNICT